jgi:hypothetical protein
VIAQETSQRKAAIRWARGVATDRRAIYLDTESTGLGPQAQIVDVALVSGDGTVLFDSFVRPTIRQFTESTTIMSPARRSGMRLLPIWRRFSPAQEWSSTTLASTAI